jgi:hypothetical protein
MVYYDNDKWHICPKIAEYRAYGKLKRSYTNNPKWWESFVNRWWHHEGLRFIEVTPTQAQLDRLELCNVAGIQEGFYSAVANYVESGIAGDGLPDSFTQQIDLSNSNKLWEYEQIVTERIQAEVDAYNKANGVSFDNVHNCKSYADDETYEHYQFCYDVWQWNKQVWSTLRQILRDVVTGVTPPPDEEEFVGMLPVFGA